MLSSVARRQVFGADVISETHGRVRSTTIGVEGKDTTIVALNIRLLGLPVIEREGQVVAPPRGRKAWAVLAYVVLHDRQVSRRQLAELLFSEADDPLGALRWTFAELRRSIGSPGAFRGDPVMVGLSGVTIDVASIGTSDPSVLLSLRGELLEGLSVDGCPVFESWLTVERYRVSAAIEGRLRLAAIGLIASGRFDDAIAFASQTVSRNVLDEANHELLVRCLAGSGDETGAARQVAVCEDVMRREFGVAASPTLRAAARSRDSGRRLSLCDRSEVNSLLEAGRAAVAAGAMEAGLNCLYSAVDKAAKGTDGGLHGRTLVALGGALVHGVRGQDGEGAIVLHEAVRVGSSVGDHRTVTIACRELGFIEVQAGHRPTATEWLQRATDLAEDDDARASILGVRGMNVSDAGQYSEAIKLLSESVALAERCGDLRQQAWSLSILARAHMLRDERGQAVEAVDRSLELVDRQRWVAFRPWPLALKAELDLVGGSAEFVTEEIEQAWALSCQLGDPCWEGMTARVLGLLCAQRGDFVSAMTWLDAALRRCESVSDMYLWVKAYVLDSMIEVALATGDGARALQLTGSLTALAARCDMAEFVVRAQLHRWRLGDAGALEAARLLAADVDNPALHRLVERHRREQP